MLFIPKALKKKNNINNDMLNLDVYRLYWIVHKKNLSILKVHSNSLVWTLLYAVFLQKKFWYQISKILILVKKKLYFDHSMLCGWYWSTFLKPAIITNDISGVQDKFFSSPNSKGKPQKKYNLEPKFKKNIKMYFLRSSFWAARAHFSHV